MAERTVVTGLGVTTLSLLILKEDYEKYKKEWDITGRPGINVMFKGRETIVPKGHFKITRKNI
jgi:hypothetical protein